MSYRMSYLLKPGPSKAREDLRAEEGLTDHLVVHSIMGTPGAETPLSIGTFALGPQGREELTGATAWTLAVSMLQYATENLPPGRQLERAVLALSALRQLAQEG